MDIVNKKRTYVWGFPTYLFGERDYKTFMLRCFLTLYNIVSLLFFGYYNVTRKLIYIYIYFFKPLRQGGSP